MLSETCIETFWREGYLHLSGLFRAEETQIWRSECKRLLSSDFVDPHNLRTLFWGEGADARVERIDPIIDVSEPFRCLARDPRIIELVAGLLGQEILLFKDKLILKMPDVRGYTMHQDWAWWQDFPQDLITILVAIDEANVDNGGVEFFSGYHNSFLQEPGKARNMTSQEAETIDKERGRLILTQPGDIVAFHCLTPHCSQPNRSHQTRFQAYLTYNPARHGDLYNQQFDHWRQYHDKVNNQHAKSQLYFA